MSSFQDLPTEAIRLIASHLDLHRDLAALSLVSRGFSITLVPSLYHTLYLGRVSHVERIIERIMAEEKTDSPSVTTTNISSHVRCLIFDDEKYESTCSREEILCDYIVSGFLVVVPRLKHLKTLAWKPKWLPLHPRLFGALREHCSELHSVEIHNWSYTFSLGKDYYGDSLFGFKDLDHLSITSQYLPPVQDQSPSQIVEMIWASPNMKSLELILGSETATGRKWSPNKFLKEVGITFPALGVLRLGGYMVDKWPATLFGSYYLKAFFEKHSGLHTISFAWTPNVHALHEITPELVASLFPSLTHFEGPAFLCAVIVNSPLSAQLESLGVLDRHIQRDESHPTGNEQADFRRLATPGALPKLRSLKLYLKPDGRVQSDISVLHQAAGGIATAAPELRELVLEGAYIDAQLKLLEALRRAPKIRTLTTGLRIMSPKILRAILGACPLLEELHDTYKPHVRTSWRIVHHPSGGVDMRRLGLPLS